ncbi:uncharacterized protein LOC121839210 [Oncorhynchus tshawytscha]|uniref:uncharacterized protein LOC121839210 n=1 Tax=Oncorhynchus tshawytscha TaxID=74940 RepID=UPI001C3E3429|nr:uncharacterized protein LOC121839210 [Oncorhynchus tshawytscha]
MTALREEIREAVLSVLPYLPEETLSSLLDKLAIVGGEGKPDLQFLKEQDLQEHIRPIQCRKQLNAWRFEDLKSFADTTKDGTTIGSGYGSLLINQMKTRVEHKNRDNPLLMQATFELQRYAINASPTPKVAELNSKWPYLFTQKTLYNNFKLLTDVSILEKKLCNDGRKRKDFHTILLLQTNKLRGSAHPVKVSATATDVEGSIPLSDSPRLIVQVNVFKKKFSFYFSQQYQEEASRTLEFI